MMRWSSTRKLRNAAARIRADAKNVDIEHCKILALRKQCGTLDVAAAKYEETLVIKRHLYGKDARNTDLAAALHNLGIVYRQLGNLAVLR